MSWNSNFRNYVMLRDCCTPKFEHEQNFKTFLQNFSFLLQITLWGLKQALKPQITRVDSFHSEMKKNSISHILVPFKMVYKPVFNLFLIFS